jgi:2-methylcitrate dehydratase
MCCVYLRYPDGIPSRVQITTVAGDIFDSGFVMYPGGHARNTSNDLIGILSEKFKKLAALCVANVDDTINNLQSIADADAKTLVNMYPSFQIQFSDDKNAF